MLENRFFVVLPIVTMLVAYNFGCARIVNMPMRIRPAGVLDGEDYRQLEVAANQYPARVGEELGTSCVPTIAYYIDDEYDFSRAKSIYIADFRFADGRMDDTVMKDTPDQLALLLSKAHVFERIERIDPVNSDVELHVVITKYQDIKSMFPLGIRCGFFLMEARIIDSKTNIKIGAIQVNHITTRGSVMGPIFTWTGSRRPEEEVPKFLLSVFEGLKAGQTMGTSSIAFDCTKDNGTTMIDQMCQ
jgi:hypothetical protein